MQKPPDSSTYVVIGGGVHGLSSAYHLALELEASGPRARIPDTADAGLFS